MTSRIAGGELNYPGIGATEHGLWPSGFQRIQVRAHLGDGIETYRRVAEGVLSWQIQRRSGLRVRTETDSVLPGTRIISGFGVGPFRINAPCEVVWVRRPLPGNAPQSAGFGYGTLPGHPERGEEAFEVSIDAAGAVSFTITAFSRHANWFYAAGGAVARAAQRYITSRYLRSARELTAG
ncbi:DUF1990 family protein [Arthrobacter sp. Soil763]|uniref:DUF1990 family protein n=1 Tax=Arthrobacter sp. Soil763 TaxID=1736402 RepID=UPI0006FAB3B2|nr:DUF1990 domain-containing protein [Arthrobacter sp. Soil763]KRE81655.1 hypothetical protein ASG71_00845 [Arthrobacter sp. Soil763]